MKKSNLITVIAVGSLAIIGGTIYKVRQMLKKKKELKEYRISHIEKIDIFYKNLSTEWIDEVDFYETLKVNGVDLEDEMIRAYAEMKYAQAEFERSGEERPEQEKEN